MQNWWTCLCRRPAEGYLITRSDGAEYAIGPDMPDTITSEPGEYTDVTAEPWVGHAYTVRAYDAAGDSASVAAGMARVPSPAPPMDLTATATSASTIELDWVEPTLTPGSAGELPGTLVRQEEGVDADFVPVANLSENGTGGGPTGTFQYVDHIPEPGVYHYRFVAPQQSGDYFTPVFSNEAYAVTVGTAQPARPVDPDDPGEGTVPATPAYTAQDPGTPGWYQVTLSPPSMGDSAADGYTLSPVLGPEPDPTQPTDPAEQAWLAHQADWLAVDGDWVQAKSADAAVMQAVSGGIQFTANVQPVGGQAGPVPAADQSFQSTFADGGFRLSPSHAAAGSDGTYTVGIDLDCDYLEGSLDWDDVDWTATAQKAGVDLTAYRTGGNFGQAVSETVKQSGDPSKYIVLVNDNYDQHLASGLPDDSADTAPVTDDQIQSTAEGSPVDSDFGRITLDMFPVGATAGTVTLTVSDPSAIVLFKQDGTKLNDTTLDLSSPTGDLQPLTAGPMDVWFEALHADPDLTISLSYSVDNHASNVAVDAVHINLVDFIYVGASGAQVIFSSPLWKDALVAAAIGQSGSLGDSSSGAGSNGVGDQTGPWGDPYSSADSDDASARGSFFRAEIQGLDSSADAILRVSSESTPADKYDEQLIPSEDNPGELLQKRMAVLYNSDMYLSNDASPLTPGERAEIQTNLGLDPVHNPDALTSLLGGLDKQARAMPRTSQVSILMNPTMDVAHVGGTITGTAISPNIDPAWSIVVNYDGQTATAAPGQPVLFNFKVLTAGYVTMTAQVHAPKLPPPAIKSGIMPATVVDSAVVWALQPGVVLSTYQQQTWDKMHVDGIVPGDPFVRNRQITSMYADMFNSGSNPARPNINPYEWFGLASLVSRNAGVAMAKAVYYGFQTGNFPDSWIAPHLGPDPRQMYDGLGQGNLAIIMDMYPQGLAYKTGGLAAINQMLAAGQITPQQQNAWSKIDQGVNTNSQALIKQGVQSIAQVEQTVTLQAIVNRDTALWDAAASLSSQTLFPIVSGVPGDKLGFTAWCTLNANIVGANYSFSSGNDRYQWFLDIFPAYLAWRTTNPTINLTTLLNGGY